MEYVQLSGALVRQTGHHAFEPRGLRVLAIYSCKRCDIEGRDPEVSPWRVFCWNCGDEPLITARIVEAA